MRCRECTTGESHLEYGNTEHVRRALLGCTVPPPRMENPTPLRGRRPLPAHMGDAAGAAARGDAAMAPIGARQDRCGFMPSSSHARTGPATTPATPHPHRWSAATADRPHNPASGRRRRATGARPSAGGASPSPTGRPAGHATGGGGNVQADVPLAPAHRAPRANSGRHAKGAGSHPSSDRLPEPEPV